MSWQKTLQQRLGVKDDGRLGPATYGALFRRLGAAAERAQALGAGAALHFPAYGIDATAQRLTEFLGETGHESGSFARLVENLNYSAAQLRKTWPGRFPTAESAQALARQPEAIANRVYAMRMGNGVEGSGDGWRYRGRGLIQLTGRANYRASALRTGLPLEGQPDIVAQPMTAVEVSAEWFRRHGLCERADRGESRAISAIINTGSPTGSPHGLSDRAARKAAIRRLWQ